jgi:hypothetical protein
MLLGMLSPMLPTPGEILSPTSLLKSVESIPSLVVVGPLVEVVVIVLDMVDMEPSIASLTKEDSKQTVVSIPMDMATTIRDGCQLLTETIIMVTTVVVTTVVDTVNTVMMPVVDNFRATALIQLMVVVP